MGSVIVAEMGLADRLVAVDAASATLPEIGPRAILPAAPDEAAARIAELDACLAIVPADAIDLAARLDAAGVSLVSVDVHDFDDAFALWRELGRRLVPERRVEIHRRIREVSRPLAGVAVESYAAMRPRVGAIASTDPLTLEGGHGFATALIEMAGGESLTHGLDESTVAITLAALRRLAPDLLLFLAADAPSASLTEGLERALGEVAPVLVVRFDSDRFFGQGANEALRRIRERVRALAPTR